MNKSSTLFSALLRLVPLKWQRILEHSRMIKYYRVLRIFRKKVFLLGGTLIFNKSMPFLFVARVSSLFYHLCLKLGSMDFFHYLISKMGFSLGSRVLLSRGLGCEGWLLLVLILAAFGIFDGTILNMTGGNETVNQGPHRGDAGPQPSTARAPNEGGHEATSQPTGESSSSGSWGQYLNFSSDKEGDSAPEPSTARAPEPSTSSTWSGPWIEKWLYPEVSSSAPDDQGPRQQGEGALFQPTDTHQEQPPAAGPSEPRGDPSHAPVESSPSLYLSDQEFLKQFFLEEDAAVEQQQQPGVPEALPQAPAPAEDPELIKKAI